MPGLHNIRRWLRTCTLVCAAIGLATAARSETAGLRPPEAFQDVQDQTEHSLALFEEAGKVLQHPRCVNCHPAGNVPLQNDVMRLHQPPVQRGDGGMGVAGMRCPTCHQVSNYDAAGVPGHPAWHLAPIEMAWEDRSLGEICEQIKDPARNGGKTLPELHEHMAEDSLVGWGWHPGPGRESAPGTQATFGRLIGAWIDSGAHCPTS